VADSPLQPTPNDKEAVTVGSKTFHPIYLGHKEDKPIIVALSQREERFIKKFLETLSVEKASEEIGISMKLAKKYLTRSNVKAVITQAVQKAAIRQGTDLDEHIVWLRKGRDGVLKPEKYQIDCAQILAKALKPSGGGINVNINNQVAVFDSPYKDMTTVQLTDAMQERINAIQGGATGPT